MITFSNSVLGTETVTYKYDNLKEPKSIQLDFKDSEYLLISAGQQYADVVLSVFEQSNKQLVFKANTSAYDGINELFLLQKQQCRQCYLQVVGFETIDKSGFVQVDVKKISINNKHYSSNDINNLKLISKLADVSIENEGDLEGLFLESMKFINSDKKINESVWRPRLLNSIVDLAYKLKKYDEIKELYKEILSSNKGDKFEIITYFNQTLFFSDLRKSKESYEKGVKLSKKNGDVFLENSGKNYLALEHMNLGENVQANYLLQEVYDYYAINNMTKRLMTPLHNLSLVNLKLGNTQKSLAFAVQLKLLADKVDSPLDKTLAWYDMGRSYNLTGQVNLANSYLDAALDNNAGYISNTSSVYVRTQAFLSEEKVRMALSQGDYEQASYHVQNMKKFYQLSNASNLYSDAFFLEAQIYLATNNIEKSIEAIEYALDYDIKNNRNMASVEKYLLLSKIKLNENNFDASKQYLHKAKENISKAASIRLQAKFNITLLNLFAKQGQLENAKKLSDDSLQSIFNHGSPDLKAEYFYLKAWISLQEGDYSSAQDNINSAKNIIEKHLIEAQRKELRKAFLALNKKVFEMDISINEIVYAEAPIETLKIVENFKARTLKEELHDLQGDNAYPKDLLDRRAELLRKIQDSALQWYGNTGVETSIVRLAQELAYALENVETEITGLKRIKNKIELQGTKLIAPQENELVLYYFLGEAESRLWVYTHDNLELIKLPNVEIVTKLTQPVIEMLVTAPALRKDSAWQNKKKLTKLSELLIGPLEKYLERIEINTIRIIPDGILNNLSFGALYFGNEGNYLGQQFELSSAPSLEVMQALTNKNKNAIEKTSLLMISQTESSLNLPQIESNIGLVNELSNNSSLELSVLKGKEANKSNFLKSIENKNDILYFSTHGLLNPQQPLLSGLLLSENNGKEEFWLLPEISNTKLKTELVVLAACDTAQGKHIEGEGLMSMSRAFLVAGARQVLATQWKVNDQATSQLMKEFFLALLDKKLSTTAALKEAQEKIINNKQYDWTDPYYWAGFQIIGGKH